VTVRDGLKYSTTAKVDTLEKGEIPSGVPTFEAVYQACGQRVLNLAFRFTHNKDTARDLTQEIFVKVYRNLNSFRGQSQIATWVVRIAMNHCLNYLKRERRMQWMNILDQSVDDALHGENPKVSTDIRSSEQRPDTIVEKNERERIVRSAIDTLPVKYRLPFVLYRFEEMSYQEIADALELSLSAVETRIHRARKHLVKKLEPWRHHI